MKKDAISDNFESEDAPKEDLDIYDDDEREDMLDNGELSDTEEAFMNGYKEAD